MAPAIGSGRRRLPAGVSTAPHARPAVEIDQGRRSVESEDPDRRGGQTRQGPAGGGSEAIGGAEDSGDRHDQRKWQKERVVRADVAGGEQQSNREERRHPDDDVRDGAGAVASRVAPERAKDPESGGQDDGGRDDANQRRPERERFRERTGRARPQERRGRQHRHRDGFDGAGAPAAAGRIETRRDP